LNLLRVFIERVTLASHHTQISRDCRHLEWWRRRCW
jgi:hypothetical protein